MSLHKEKFCQFSIIRKEMVALLICVVFIAVFCFTLVVYGSSPETEPTLRFLSIIHRHGERSPTFTFPTDPYKDGRAWPEGQKQLTMEGKLNIFRNGELLRERYNGFLPENYKPEQVYVRSSDVDRTIMSAQGLLAGLYPPRLGQVWNSDLLWQPIPVHSIPSSVDNLIGMGQHCHALSEEKKQIERNEGRKIIESNQELFDSLANFTGREFKTVHRIYLIYDYLLILTKLGLELPQWANTISLERLYNLTEAYFQLIVQTPTMRRLSSGVLLHDIIENMEKKTEPKEDYRRLINIYSGHESTIYTLWESIGMTEKAPVPPSLGSTLIFELHFVDDEYRVKDRRLIVVEKFENCKGTYPFQFLHFTAQRKGPYLILNGEEIVSRDMANKTAISARVEKCKDKSNPDTCEYYITWRWEDACVPYKVLPFLKTYIDAHEPKVSCPVKKGNYTVKNAKIDADTLAPFLASDGGSRVMWKFLIRSEEFGNVTSCLVYFLRLAHVKAAAE